MIDDAPDDAVMGMLASLPVPTGDRARSLRLRARCHAELRARGEKLSAPSRALRVSVGFLGAAYLAEVVKVVVVVWGWAG